MNPIELQIFDEPARDLRLGVEAQRIGAVMKLVGPLSCLRSERGARSQGDRGKGDPHPEERAKHASRRTQGSPFVYFSSPRPSTRSPAAAPQDEGQEKSSLDLAPLPRRLRKSSLPEQRLDRRHPAAEGDIGSAASCLAGRVDMVVQAPRASVEEIARLLKPRRRRRRALPTTGSCSSRRHSRRRRRCGRNAACGGA